MNVEKKLQKRQIRKLRKALEDAEYHFNQLQSKKHSSRDKQQMTESNEEQQENMKNDQQKDHGWTDIDEKIRQGFENLVNFILSLD